MKNLLSALISARIPSGPSENTGFYTVEEPRCIVYVATADELKVSERTAIISSRLLSFFTKLIHFNANLETSNTLTCS
jgi:hypothetical protein